MSKFVYAIEGLDRLGKSTLVEGIQRELGFFQIIHFGKPQRLEKYQGALMPENLAYDKDVCDPQLFHYQRECFRNSMKLVQSGARIIFDRWHLGEAVYAPMYRKYDGNYVFDLEKRYDLDEGRHVRLILLTEDFVSSQHFESDGMSFDDSKREDEQNRFIASFNKSVIQDKRIICVTDPKTGRFRDADDILKEALA